jgi:hypothetical protein
VVIIDEAAHIDPQLFFKVIIPILSISRTSLLCLSSPEGESKSSVFIFQSNLPNINSIGNYYSGLLNLTKTDGSPFFQVIQCAQICDKCKKLERVKQINCNHVKSTAHWLSSKKIRELKQLYKASPEDAIREFGGVVVSDYKPALVKEEIDRCFKMPMVETTAVPQYVFTACDPNGGGPSHMSIASGYFAKNGDFVVSEVCACNSAASRPSCTQRVFLVDEMPVPGREAAGDWHSLTHSE